MANIVKNDAKISVTKNDMKVSVTIELNDVSEKDYEDIFMYIKSKVGMNSHDDVSKQTEERPVDSQSTIKTVNMKDLSDRIDSLYDSYERNKKNYILVHMSSQEFIDAHPELGAIHPTPVGRILSQVSKGLGLERFPIERTTVYNKSMKRRVQSNIFTVPLRCETLGKKIKAFREANLLSTKELADAIGYPVSVVDSWQKDATTPSSEAIREMIKIFGGDFKKIFDQEAK